MSNKVKQHDQVDSAGDSACSLAHMEKDETLDEFGEDRMCENAESDITISNLDSTDGLFTFTFLKKKQHTNTHISQSKDEENIVFTHTKHEPKQPDTKLSFDFDPDTYEVNTFPRGIVTLINIKQFHKKLLLGTREGTDKDAERICKLFLDLGFIVNRYDNPSCDQILEIMEKAALADYSKMSCCVCAILSHGKEGYINGTDGRVKITEITSLFKTNGLVGKPKLFLFQACRGRKYMDPMSLDVVDGKMEVIERDGISKPKKPEVVLLPSEADFLYAYSTVPEYFSWRSVIDGSWFIETVSCVFRQLSQKLDVNRMLTRVNGQMANRESYTEKPSTDGKRQIASIVSQLRKDLFLYSPYGALPRD